MKIGMRTIKTAIAAVLTIFISSLLGAESPFFAVIAAMITMQVTVTDSFRTGRDRILGTIIGAFLGLVSNLIAPGHPLAAGVGIIVLIYICNVMNWNQTISIASVVFLSIVINPQEGNIFIYGMTRVLDTMLGIGIGLMVNYFISPPNLAGKIKRETIASNKEIKDMLREIITKTHPDEISACSSINNLKSDVDLMEKESKVHGKKGIPTDSIKQYIEYMDSIHNHLAVLSSLANFQYVDEINRKTLIDRYGINVKVEKKPPIKEEMVFNYHLGVILEMIKQLDALTMNI